MTNHENRPSDAVERFRTAVDDVLHARSGVELFLRHLERRGLPIRRFENPALLESFSTPLSGGSGGGDQWRDGPLMYTAMSDRERGDIRKHYLQRLDEAERNFPELKVEFPQIFR